MQSPDSLQDSTSAPDARAPSFQQWWDHLRRNGVLAAAAVKMSPVELAELATATYGEALERFSRQVELASLVASMRQPLGNA